MRGEDKLFEAIRTHPALKTRCILFRYNETSTFKWLREEEEKERACSSVGETEEEKKGEMETVGEDKLDK